MSQKKHHIRVIDHQRSFRMSEMFFRACMHSLIKSFFLQNWYSGCLTSAADAGNVFEENVSKMGGEPFLSSLSQRMGATTSWLWPEDTAAVSRRRPAEGAIVASPARANRAFRRASCAAMPVAQGPHMMLVLAMPATCRAAWVTLPLSPRCILPVFHRCPHSKSAYKCGGPVALLDQAEYR